VSNKLTPLLLGPFESASPKGVLTFDSARPGPHVAITALIHGNELCGLYALNRLAGNMPTILSGKLSLILCNLDAYSRLDPREPVAARAVDEDLNRVWDPSTLDGPRQSRELSRARDLRPLINQIDHLLDLHSMTLPAPPILIAGPRAKNRRLAQALGLPYPILVDAGHAAGSRLRDYGPFDDEAKPHTALLIECGQHEAVASADIAYATCLRFLAHFGIIESSHEQVPIQTPLIVEVTHTITVKDQSFTWAQAFGGFECVPKVGTLLGHEAGAPLVTPYDNCYLIMPNRRIAVGQTAVRLGRVIGA
jgi:predicted deacylase